MLIIPLCCYSAKGSAADVYSRVITLITALDRKPHIYLESTVEVLGGVDRVYGHTKVLTEITQIT
jgi:hypothetical protein